MRKINLDKNIVLDKLENGQNFVEIANDLGCEVRVVRRHAKELGFTENRRYKNIQGKKINSLTIIKPVNDNRIGQYWLCRCDCGKEKILSGRKIRAGDVKACGCLLGGWEGYKEIGKSFISTLKNGAISRNLPFEISIENIWDLYEKQNRKCNLSGKEIHFSKGIKGKNNTTCSVDRINPYGGYTLDNIQIIHKKMQIIKWILNQEQVQYWCGLVTNPVKTVNDIKIIERTSNKGGWTGCGNISGGFFSGLRTSAKRRNIELDLSIEDLWNKYLEQNGCCAITGVPIKFSTKRSTASLDRISNKDHYHKNNIQFVHKVVNGMRHHLEMDEFKDWCSKTYNYNQQKIEQGIDISHHLLGDFRKNSKWIDAITNNPMEYQNEN